MKHDYDTKGIQGYCSIECPACNAREAKEKAWVVAALFLFCMVMLLTGCSAVRPKQSFLASMKSCESQGKSWDYKGGKWGCW